MRAESEKPESLNGYNTPTDKFLHLANEAISSNPHTEVCDTGYEIMRTAYFGGPRDGGECLVEVYEIRGDQGQQGVYVGVTSRIPGNNLTEESYTWSSPSMGGNSEVYSQKNPDTPATPENIMAATGNILVPCRAGEIRPVTNGEMTEIMHGMRFYETYGPEWKAAVERRKAENAKDLVREAGDIIFEENSRRYPTALLLAEQRAHVLTGIMLEAINNPGQNEETEKVLRKAFTKLAYFSPEPGSFDTPSDEHLLKLATEIAAQTGQERICTATVARELDILASHVYITAPREFASAHYRDLGADGLLSLIVGKLTLDGHGAQKSD